MTDQIRVMLVDDHTMVRKGLVTFLKVYDFLKLVGEAENGADAIKLCAEVLPDVVLMDMFMPDMDGATATTLIRQKFPQVQVLVLTSFKEGELIQKALEAGAIGYLLKDVSADDLSINPSRNESPVSGEPMPPSAIAHASTAPSGSAESRPKHRRHYGHWHKER